MSNPTRSRGSIPLLETQRGAEDPTTATTSCSSLRWRLVRRDGSTMMLMLVVLLLLLFLLLLLAQPRSGILLGLPVRLLPLGAVVHEEHDSGGEAEDDEALDDALVAEVFAKRLPVAARDPVVVELPVAVVVVVVVCVFLEEVGDPFAQGPVLPFSCSEVLARPYIYIHTYLHMKLGVGRRG